MTNNEILDYHYEFMDCPANSIREYLFQLLITLWNEGEGFSGKRPFGNSGWEYDLLTPLVEMGVIDGVIDEDGYLEDAYEVGKEGFPLIRELIHYIFNQDE